MQVPASRNPALVRCESKGAPTGVEDASVGQCGEVVRREELEVARADSRSRIAQLDPEEDEARDRLSTHEGRALSPPLTSSPGAIFVSRGLLGARVAFRRLLLAGGHSTCALDRLMLTRAATNLDPLRFGLLGEGDLKR